MCFGENTVKDAVPVRNDGAFQQILSAVCFVEKAFRIATLNKEDLFLLILSE